MRKISVISIVLVSILAFGACSSSENSNSEGKKSSSNSTNAFAASLKATNEAQSYKFTAVVETSGNIGGTQTDGQITMSGINSADGKTSLVIVDLNELLGGTNALGVLGSNVDLEIEQRVIDGIAYTKNLDILGTGNETWIKQDLSEFLESGAAQNPNQYLQYLQAADSGVEKVGTETINDIETTHYRAVLSKEKINEYFNSKEWKQYYEEQGLSEEDFNGFKDSYVEGLSETPIDLWIDENDLPVRMKIATKVNSAGLTGLAADGGDSELSSVFTIDFSDWGTQLDVQAPPADQVVTQEQYEQQIKDSLLGQLGI